jgi:hypothetical protein
VHHPADRALSTGVDDPAGVRAGDATVVAEAGGDVVHVVLALDQPLAGVERLRPGEFLAVPLDQVRDAAQQRTALASRGRRPRSPVERAARRGDSGQGVLPRALSHGRHEAAVGRAADLAAPTCYRLAPLSSDVQSRHDPLPSCAVRIVALYEEQHHPRTGTLAEV